MNVCVHLSSGVHTSDILTVYISAIKALRELDPSMVILQVACQPIRKYLRSVADRGSYGSTTAELKSLIFSLAFHCGEV